MLDKTSEELAVAKQLLKEKKGRAKRARSKLARENAKRAAKVVKKTLESIEDHQDLLLRTENARQNREVRSAATRNRTTVPDPARRRSRAQ
jgi:hypothetical protein